MARPENPAKQSIPGTFGHLLLSARRQRGLGIQECALQAGLSPTQMANIETGERTPNPKRVPDLARVYGVSPEILAWSWLSSFAPVLIPYLHKSPLPDEELYSMLLENAQLARQREESLHADLKGDAHVEQDSVDAGEGHHR